MPETSIANVIVLTPGLSGSSVLTKLISQAGHWTGDSTFAKHDYDTQENYELIQLNEKIIRASGYTGDYQWEFSTEAIDMVDRLDGTIDETPFRTFIDKCNQHQPWIWKDPRLWLTIRYWQRLIDLSRCRFVVLTRQPMQLWISAILRRHIQTPEFCRNYNERIVESITEFLETNQLPYDTIFYDDLVMKPEPTIDRVNRLLGTELTLEDLKHVFRGKLYRKPRTSADLFKALLIYFKNYRQRYR